MIRQSCPTPTIEFLTMQVLHPWVIIVDSRSVHAPSWKLTIWAGVSAHTSLRTHNFEVEQHWFLFVAILMRPPQPFPNSPSSACLRGAFWRTGGWARCWRCFHSDCFQCGTLCNWSSWGCSRAAFLILVVTGESEIVVICHIRVRGIVLVENALGNGVLVRNIWTWDSKSHFPNRHSREHAVLCRGFEHHILKMHVPDVHNSSATN